MDVRTYVSTAVRREQEPCYKHNQYAKREKERRRQSLVAPLLLVTTSSTGSPITFPYCRRVLRQLLVKISRGRTWEHRPLTACLYFDRAHLEINRHSFRASGITICLYYPCASNGRCECRILVVNPPESSGLPSRRRLLRRGRGRAFLSRHSRPRGRFLLFRELRFLSEESQPAA